MIVYYIVSVLFLLGFFVSLDGDFYSPCNSILLPCVIVYYIVSVLFLLFFFVSLDGD